MYHTVTIKYDGQFHEISLEMLSLDDRINPSDENIRLSLSEYLDGANLSDYVIEKGDTIINLRPTAEFGAWQ